jgi:hypothetical protein
MLSLRLDLDMKVGFKFGYVELFNLVVRMSGTPVRDLTCGTS